jgi:hypothetical protein
LSYFADATQLQPGSIVRVEMSLSSSGKPTYPHFFIVLDVPDLVQSGSIIPLIGISSRIESKSADPAKHVSMKWLNRKGGDPETGFDKPCHACMDFTHILTIYKGNIFHLEVAAEYQWKFIKADKLRTVVATMNNWNKRRTNS